MIIEFFGLPGSGKTTLCNKISKEDNLKNPMLFYKESFAGKIIFHLFLYFFFLNAKLRKKYREAMSLLNSKKYINIVDSNVKINLYIKYMLFIYYLESHFDNIVIDEGIIHYMIALNSEFGVEFEKLDEIYNIFKIESKNIIYRCTKCDIDVAINNCKIRNRKSTALDFLNYEELHSVEMKYKIAENYYVKFLKIS